MRLAFLFVSLATVTDGYYWEPTIGSAAKSEPESSELKLELQHSPLAVKFINIGKEPIRILKPLDGSEWCWIMPHYKLTVINENDREIGYAARCKVCGFPYMGTKWPDDYVVDIVPGGSYVHKLQHNHNIRKAGNYRIRFEYLFTPKSNRTPGGPYPAGLWRGSATSNTLETKLTPRE